MLAKALRLSAVKPFIISIGRGRSTFSNAFFPGKVTLEGGVPVYYAPFTSSKLLTYLLSLYGLLKPFFRLQDREFKAAIFYNRLSAYLPALLIARILGYRCILDLEDGEANKNGSIFQEFYFQFLRLIFDLLCNGGALLACESLRSLTSAKRVQSYYGVSDVNLTQAKFLKVNQVVLVGGSLSEETGVHLLAEAIRIMRSSGLQWVRNISFVVTGYGPGLALLSELASDTDFPAVKVYGRVNNQTYQDLLLNSDIGLALKLNHGLLARTTFPSKVIEYASSGLLVITTDISDVRSVLGSGALFLIEDDPHLLMKLLELAVVKKSKSTEIARLGSYNVHRICSPELAAKRIKKFIFGTE
jgi:glycosyltransferase involved in cell wall biosynthesis